MSQGVVDTGTPASLRAMAAASAVESVGRTKRYRHEDTRSGTAAELDLSSPSDERLRGVADVSLHLDLPSQLSDSSRSDARANTVK